MRPTSVAPIRSHSARGSRRILAVLAASGLLVVQGPVGAADGEVKPTRNVNATQTDLNPGRLYSTPFLSVDPSDSKVVIGSYAELRSRRCGLMRSTDGGITWSRAEGSPSPDDYPFCVWNNFQSYSAMGRDGTAYVALSGWDDRDGGARTGNISMLLAQSEDLGDTWRTTVVNPVRGREGEDAEQQRPASLVVDSKRGSNDIVYVSWNRTMPGRAAPNAEPSRPMVAVSADGGRTFGSPIDLSQGQFTQSLRSQAFSSATTTSTAPGATTTSTTTPAAGSRAATPDQEANFGGSNPRLAMDDKGNVYAIWRSATANVPNARPAAPATFMSTSTDRGKTWNTSLVGVDYTLGSALRLVWSPEGSSDGSLHFVFSRNPTPTVSGVGEIFHQRSTDRGKTWSEPKQVTDDDPSMVHGQYEPGISVAPNGRLDVVWFDTRDDPGIRANDVYYSYSTDNGTTWSKNMRVSDTTINRTYGVWANNYDHNGPPGIASSNELAVVGWDDTRNTDPSIVQPGEFGAGVQDIFTSSVQFEAIGGGTPKAAKIALAAIAGLAAVAGLLLVVTFASRRRTPPPPRERKTTRTPVGVS